MTTQEQAAPKKARRQHPNPIIERRYSDKEARIRNEICNEILNKLRSRLTSCPDSHKRGYKSTICIVEGIQQTTELQRRTP